MGTRGRGSILGHIKGKVGTVVLKDWKDVSVVQSLPTKKVGKKKKSDGQSQRHDLFNTVGHFLSGAVDAIDIGYQQRKKATMTPMNAATSYNMLNAITGEFPDWKIDFSKVKFSAPIDKTENGWNIQLVGDAETPGQIFWEINAFPERTTFLDDSLVVVCYYKVQNKTYAYRRVVHRSALIYALPKVWMPLQPVVSPDGETTYQRIAILNEVHCWVYFISADKKRVSETEYLGMITVKT